MGRQESAEAARLEEIRRQEELRRRQEQARLEAIRLEQQRAEEERLRQEQLLLIQQQIQNEQSFSSSSSQLDTLFGSGHEVSVSSQGGEHSYTGQVSSDGSVGK